MPVVDLLSRYKRFAKSYRCVSPTTLEEVLDHYNTGGVPSSTIDPFMKYTTGGLALSPVQKTHLLAFLETLTDTSFIAASQFQDPH